MKNLIDLHTHSVLSTHGFSTLTENINVANQKGLKYYGISEHQYDTCGVGPHHFAFHNLRIVPKEINGTKFLRGCEFNILPDGSIDTTRLKPENLDYGIASIHGYAYKDQGVELNTKAYLSSLDNDYIKIVGHLDDGHYPVNFDPIVNKAKQLHKLIEINNTSLKPTTNRINARENMIQLIKSCIKYDEDVIINSDAHICYDVGQYELAYDLLVEYNFPLNKVLNFNEDLIIEYFYK